MLLNVKQNILVLGGNGFIGSHLVDRLIADGHFVRVFDKYPERYRAPLPEVEYHLGDFGNRGLLLDALRDIDVVYHLISTSLPKTSNDDPAFDVQSNVIETLFLLEQCLAKSVLKFVFVSSGGTVYGRPDRLPIVEESPTNPECSYGITKLTIEKYLNLYHHLHGLDYVVVRPSNPYGSNDFLYNHLSDPVSPAYGERLLAVIYHYQVHEPAVVGIDRAGSIHKAYAVF